MMLTLLVALLCSLTATGLVIQFLRRAQVLDIPNGRSSHTLPVPRGGGVAVVLTVVLVGLVVAPTTPEIVALAAVTLGLAAVGLVDDLRPLSSSLRLVAQVAGGVAMCAAVLWNGQLGLVWVLVLFVVMVAYTNAFNFMDGVNGISALTAILVGIFWVLVSALGNGPMFAPVWGLALAGAGLGFLPWNFPNARVFLGDVGSYGLGALVAGFSVLAIGEGVPWHWALAPLAVYGADTGWVLVKRLIGGRPLTEAHREHVYQRLTDQGWSHGASASLCVGTTAVVCAVALASGRALDWWTAPVVALVLAGYLMAPGLRARSLSDMKGATA